MIFEFIFKTNSYRLLSVILKTCFWLFVELCLEKELLDSTREKPRRRPLVPIAKNLPFKSKLAVIGEPLDTYLPSHVVPSMFNVYPWLQEQVKLPRVLTHSWLQ